MTGALWVDAGNGAAGDMLLAALLDAGADLAEIRAGLARLPVERLEVRAEQVRRHGFRATLATVTVPDVDHHRGLSDVLSVVAAGGLSPAVAAFATAAFTRLAEAEARVHGVGPDEVHFHEVGALDAIADVVGCGLALDQFGLLAPGTVRVVSPVAVGSGTVTAAHGRMPVPAPAVLELLTRAGAPVAAHPAQMELCTPTGAALLATLADRWGPPPAGTPRAVGVGAGRADPAGHPNVLRLLVADAPTGAGSGTGPAGGDPQAYDWRGEDWREDDLRLVETTIDDLDPRIWPDLLAELRAAGAADAWCVPALMPKGRPGQVLSVLVDPERLDLICRLVFTRTTTLGVRIRPVTRRALARDQVAVPVTGGTVRVKRGFLAGDVVTVQPEYDDALAVSRDTGRPVADVLTEARAAAPAPSGSAPPAPSRSASSAPAPAPSAVPPKPHPEARR